MTAIETRVDGQHEMVDVERRAMRKVRRAFLPIIAVCLFMLYIDRLNVSVAALPMDKQLGVSLTTYGLIAGAFFWTYALGEVPSNYLVQRLGVRLWVSRIIVSWGVVTMLTALVQGRDSLLLLRLLLGAAEAGFAPALVFFVCSWFPKAHRGAALAVTAAAIPLSGLSAPISAHIITATDGLGGLAGWRWMFLLTGLPAVVLGFMFHRVIRNRPADATFLDEDERTWLELSLAAEATAGQPRRSFTAGLADRRVVLLTVGFALFTFTSYGYQFFLPQILAGFSLSLNQIGWLTALPPLLAVAPMVVLAAHSDRRQERFKHIAAAAVVGAIGFLIAGYGLHNVAVAMVGFCIAGVGIYSYLPIQLSLPSTFLSGPALAAAVALISGIGNVGSYLGPQLTAVLRTHSADYRPAILVFAVCTFALALLMLVLGLRRQPVPALVEG
jgi:MFS transporter, ACS family, tartrate transporter